jgi:exopolysaccharide biosynthesis protein
MIRPMAYRTRLVIFASLLLAGCGLLPPGSESWETVHPAVSYRRYSPLPDSIIHIARIDLTHPQVKLKLSHSAERGRPIDQFPEHEHALVAINASFFDKRFAPVGLTISNGDVWPDAYDTANKPVLACDATSRCRIHAAPPDPGSIEKHLAVAGLPALLEDGKDASAALCNVSVGRKKFCDSAHPRTAIGLDAMGRTLWIVAAEGRHPPVLGVSVAELISVLRQLGATDAINLDGGGSSTLSIKGRQLMQRPDNEQNLRVIGNAFFVLDSTTTSPSRHRLLSAP